VRLLELMRLSVREEVRAAFAEARPANGGDREAYVSPKRAAELTGMAEWTIRDWIRTGRLKAYKAGRMWRIKREDLDAMLARGGVERSDVKEEARAIVARHVA
jgi:excisionase family DNA binding protein